MFLDQWIPFELFVMCVCKWSTPKPQDAPNCPTVVEELHLLLHWPPDLPPPRPSYNLLMTCLLNLFVNLCLLANLHICVIFKNTLNEFWNFYHGTNVGVGLFEPCLICRPNSTSNQTTSREFKGAYCNKIMMAIKWIIFLISLFCLL
jgi:hypothetical protein